MGINSRYAPLMSGVIATERPAIACEVGVTPRRDGVMLSNGNVRE